MNTAVATTQDRGAIMENVLIQGDLSKLTPEQRSSYYLKVCDSVGLNAMTKPFEYITLNGKLTLYAKRDATDQLRTVHNVSVDEMTESEREGVFIVTCKVHNGAGRTDVSKGAVNIAGLKGDALANAMMKAETKAKRRATLSICGLGLLDETEIETIAGAMPLVGTEGDTFVKPLFKNASLRNSWCKGVIEQMEKAPTKEEILEVLNQWKPKCDELIANGNEHDMLAVDAIKMQASLILKRFKAAPKEGSAADEAAMRGIPPEEDEWDNEPASIAATALPAGEEMPKFLARGR